MVPLNELHVEFGAYFYLLPVRLRGDANRWGASTAQRSSSVDVSMEGEVVTNGVVMLFCHIKDTFSSTRTGKVFLWSWFRWLEMSPIDRSPLNSIIKYFDSTNLCAGERPLVAPECTCRGVNVSLHLLACA